MEKSESGREAPRRPWRFHASGGRLSGRRGVPAALLLNAGAAVASFGATVILARTSGAVMLGHYTLAVSTGTMLAVLALLGLDRITMRTIAGDLRQGLTGEARGALRTSWRLVVAMSLALLLLYLVALHWLPRFRGFDSDPLAMLLGGGAIVSVALMRLGLSALRGAGRQLAAQGLDTLPTYVFALCIGLAALAGSVWTSARAVALFVGLQLVAAGIAWILLGRQAVRWGRPASVPAARLVGAGIPMMLIILIHSFSDWMLVSTLADQRTAADAGAFRVAAQIISIPTLVIATVETYYSPLFAGDFRARRPDLAWERQHRANRMLVLMMVPMLAAVAVFARPLLGLLFGPEFASAATALRILAAGQLVNVLTGPIGGFVAMAGHERLLLLLAFGGLAALLALNWALVPVLGVAGAAVAWSAAIALRSGGAFLFARRAIGVRA